MAVTLNASTSSGLVQTADTSGNIELQSNGTTKATVSSSGLAIGQYNPSTSLVTSGTAVATTSGTSIDFTSIPSWVKRITVMMNGVSTNGSSLVQIQLGSGSVTTTGYTSFSGWFGSAGQTATSNVTSGFSIAGGNAVCARNVNMQISLQTTNTWVASHSGGDDGLSVVYSGGGNIALGGALDRVRITTINGTDTFDAGSINILYE
jgi:hypothetical protein